MLGKGGEIRISFKLPEVRRTAAIGRVTIGAE
jgi:hypothetical protein